MIRILLLIWPVLCFAFPAWATSPDAFAAYWFGTTTTPVCNQSTQLCTELSVTVLVPSVTQRVGGEQEINLLFLGTNSIGTNTCPSGCLFQLGLSFGVNANGSNYTPDIWWELYCETGAPCNLLQPVSFGVSIGDILRFTMTCVTSCTPNSASQRWRLTVVNETTGLTCHINTTNGCSGGNPDFAIAGNLDEFEAALEYYQNKPSVFTMHLSRMALGVNGNAAAPAVGGEMTTNVDIGGGNRFVTTVSPPVNASDFDFCQRVAPGTSRFLCPVSAYRSAVNGMGP